MNTTRALLKKDVPWLLFFLAGGTAGMVAALCSSPFVYTFIVTPGHREELFHVAWSCGVGLGVVAACFDELLGTREFLACRPVSAGGVLRARLVGCLSVLAGWFVLVPSVAYTVFALIDPAWQPGWFRQLPSIWGAMLPAVSMCAVGLCAGGLPFPWWVRLLCLPPMVVIPFSVIFVWAQAWERSGNYYMAGSGTTSWPAFVGGHLALAALAVAWAASCRRFVRDPDRPVAATLRRRLLTPLLGVTAISAVLVLQFLTATAVRRLHANWPQLVLHDGKPVLAVRPDWAGPWLVVDADHRLTGERLSSAPRVGFTGLGVGRDSIRVEAPRDTRYRSAGARVGGALLLDADGTAFWQQSDGRMHQVAKTTASPRFGAKARVEALVKRGASQTVVAEPGQDTLQILGAGTFVVAEPGDDAVWILDPAARNFVRAALADGDRVVERQYDTTIEPLPDATLVPSDDESLLRGERFGYALRDRGLVKVVRLVPAPPAPSDDEATRYVRHLEMDCLGGTLEHDLGPGVAPFRHRFEPRTATERAFAGVALMLSAIRPPVMQLPSGLVSVPPLSWGRGIDETVGERPRLGWAVTLLDALIWIGGRWWLVAVSVAVAVLVTWGTRRRLRRVGADAGTLRFWTVAVLLLGPVGALVAIACERPRAWADRTVRIPVPAPRIVSPTAAPEVLA
ncbi:MAG: hypothetical protein WAT39_23685 [Planctomycetota bacterium]